MTVPTPRSFVPTPVRIGLVAIAILLGVLAFSDLWAADLWWQLATGRSIVENGAVPSVDPFSTMTAGRDWIEPRWGFETLLYLLHRSTGALGLTVARTLLLGATFLLLLRTHPTRRLPGIGGIALLLAIVAASDRFRVRPELATFLGIALFLFCLERHRRSGDRRWLIPLPLATIVWANLHSLALLGPILIATYGLGAVLDRERRRRATGRAGPLEVRTLSVVGVLTLGALFVNPYGARAALLPWTLWQEIQDDHAYADRILEFRPPGSFLQVPGSTDLVWPGLHIVAYGLLLVLLAAALLRPEPGRGRRPPLRRVPSAHLLLAIAFAYLSLEAVRNVALFALVSLPVVAARRARLGRSTPPGLFDRTAALATPIVALGIVAGVVTDHLHVLEGSDRRFGTGIAEHRFPIEAVRFLEDLRPPGDGFSSLRDASYLIWRGFPVYADGRLELHDPRTLENYHQIASGQLDPRMAPGLENLGWCLVDHRTLQPLVTRFHRPGSPWHLAYVDGTHALYLFDPPGERAPPVENLAKARAERRPTLLAASDATLHRRLGDFYYRANLPDRAIEFLSNADRLLDSPLARPLHPRSRLHWALALIDRGARRGSADDIERARRRLEEVVEQAPEWFEPHQWLGFLAEKPGRDPTEAVEHYRRYLALGGSDPDVERRLRLLVDDPPD